MLPHMQVSDWCTRLKEPFGFLASSNQEYGTGWNNQWNMTHMCCRSSSSSSSSSSLLACFFRLYELMAKTDLLACEADRID
jgi:hypothetical protein